MDRIHDIDVAATKPAYSSSGTAGFFQDDDPEADPPVLGTVPNQDWYNGVTEEMRNLIVMLGGTPDHEDDTQIATLLGTVLGDHAARIGALEAAATWDDQTDTTGVNTVTCNSQSGEATTKHLTLATGEMYTFILFSNRIGEHSVISIHPSVQTPAMETRIAGITTGYCAVQVTHTGVGFADQPITVRFFINNPAVVVP